MVIKIPMAILMRIKTEPPLLENQLQYKKNILYQMMVIQNQKDKPKSNLPNNILYMHLKYEKRFYNFSH